MLIKENMVMMIVVLNWACMLIKENMVMGDSSTYLSMHAY